MMPRLFLNLTLFLLLQISLAALNPGHAENQRIETLLLQSGIQEQIRQFPDAMTFKIGQIYELGQCDENSYNAINQALARTINRGSMQKIVMADVSKGVSTSDLEKLQAWYTSPLGEKITSHEQAASTTQAYDEIKKQGDILLADQRKLALVKKIDATLHATDWAVNVELQSTIALLGGLAQIQNKDITASLVQFASQLEEQKALLKPQVEKSVLLWYMYAYKKISNRELEEYLAFLQQDAANNFNKTALKSLSHAITEVVEDFILEVEAQSRAKRQEQ